MKRDEVIGVGLWLFLPVTIGLLTRDIQTFGIVLGIVTIFMPLQCFYGAKAAYVFMQWAWGKVRARWNKAGGSKGERLVEGPPDTVYPPAEGVQMLSEGGD